MIAIRNTTRALAAAVVVLVTGCNTEGPTQPIVFVGPSTLVVTDLRAGEGATLAVGQRATFHYGLWLYDPKGADFKGTLVEDSRLTSFSTGVTFRIAADSIIQGLVDGMPGMKVGGFRRLIIPPSLAYGTTGNGPIPPNAWVVFDVDLLAVAD